MDGSGASSGEGCLGRFRHLPCFLLVFAPVPLRSARRSSTLGSLDLSQSRWVQQLPDPATIEFFRRSIHTPVLSAGWDGRS